MRKKLKIGIVVLSAIIIIVASIFAVIDFDLASYSDTSTKTLNPTGATIGRALVVYSPGLSGAAKQDAAKIAENLQTKGYSVDLAGVRSGTAGNKSNYNIIVAGGPMYWGQVSSSIDGYLKTLPSNIKLGVFGATGSNTLVQSDFETLSNQVALDTHNSNVSIKLVLDGNETNDCAELVSTLIQQG